MARRKHCEPTIFQEVASLYVDFLSESREYIGAVKQHDEESRQLSAQRIDMLLDMYLDIELELV